MSSRHVLAAQSRETRTRRRTAEHAVGSAEACISDWHGSEEGVTLDVVGRLKPRASVRHELIHLSRRRIGRWIPVGASNFRDEKLHRWERSVDGSHLGLEHGHGRSVPVHSESINFAVGAVVHEFLQPRKTVASIGDSRADEFANRTRLPQRSDLVPVERCGFRGRQSLHLWFVEAKDGRTSGKRR